MKFAVRTIPLLIVGFVLGCASHTQGTARPSSPAPTATRASDTIWYVSARAHDATRGARVFADSLEYGFVVHSHRVLTGAPVGKLSMVLTDSVQLPRDAFLEALRQSIVTTSPDTGIALLYVHGYATSLHECWQYASEARIRSRNPAAWIAFCWPSGGSGVAKPTRDDFLDGGYVGDSIAAVASRPMFILAARTVLEAVPAARLLLVAHSMGSQLLGSALADSTALRLQLLAMPARAIVFVAADVDAVRFHDAFVPALRPLTSRLVEYTSGRDRMLALSRRRSRTLRAGAIRDAARSHPDIEIVDATDGLAAESWFQRHFGTHHTVRRAVGVLFDMIDVVGAGRAATCRTEFGTATMRSDSVWAMTSIRPPADVRKDACASHFHPR